MSRPAALVVVLAGLGVLWPGSKASAQGSPAERVLIDYVAPAKAAHLPLYNALKERAALERVRDVLAWVRWPRPLRLELRGCEGESNAWYEDAKVTVCYEFLQDAWLGANAKNRPPEITPEDAFVGAFTDVFLHEAGHALFDLLSIPILGREEDAADQVAAYLVLQLPKDTSRKLVLGSAWAYASQLNVRSSRDLYRRRLEVGRHITFSDEHGTPAQRLYNLLCVAYGSDTDLFADLVTKGFLPKQRAEGCEAEYRQVDSAFRVLIAPHVDQRR